LDRCIVQSGEVFNRFLADFLDHSTRVCLVIGGAGFDSARNCSARLPIEAKARQHPRVVLSVRKGPHSKPITQYADAHQKTISQFLSNSKIEMIEIFADGRTVSGGRRAVEAFALRAIRLYNGHHR